MEKYKDGHTESGNIGGEVYKMKNGWIYRGCRRKKYKHGHMTDKNMDGDKQRWENVWVFG